MNFLLSTLSWLSFAIIATVCALSSWAYSAWEMWYFWPFAGLIFLAALLQGARFLIHALVNSQDPDGPMTHQVPRIRVGPTMVLFAATLPFLLYATLRFTQTPVFMEAQRSYLLHATSALLALTVIFGFTRTQLKWLLAITGASIFLQAIAGPIWLYGYDDKLVLFRENLFGYKGRAKSSYFCPDHYSASWNSACASLWVSL